MANAAATLQHMIALDTADLKSFIGYQYPIALNDQWKDYERQLRLRLEAGQDTRYTRYPTMMQRPRTRR